MALSMLIRMMKETEAKNAIKKILSIGIKNVSKATENLYHNCQNQAGEIYSPLSVYKWILFIKATDSKTIIPPAITAATYS